MKGWKDYKFSDFVNINPIVQLNKASQYSFVEMKNIDRVNKYCEPQQYKYLSGGSRFQNDDTLFARITPCLENGKIAKVRNLINGKGFGSTEFLVFRAYPSISNDDFVYYLARWNEVRDFAEKNMEGSSGRQRVSKECFSNLILNLPQLAEQSAIAAVLSSLDDKIDLLHRQNATLEAMAEALFRQCFVVEEKECWENVQIKDVAGLNEKTKLKNYPYTEIQYLDTGSITDDKIEKLQIFPTIDAPSRAQRLVSHNDILISMVRPNQRHYGIIQYPPDNMIVSTGFLVLTCKNISPYFLFLLLTSSDMTEFLSSIAEGSTSAYPALKPSDIGNIVFKYPPKDNLDKFNEYACSAWKKINSNKTQIRTLEKLRDTLLPKLMSGEVRVDY